MLTPFWCRISSCHLYNRKSLMLNECAQISVFFERMHRSQSAPNIWWSKPTLRFGPAISTTVPTLAQTERRASSQAAPANLIANGGRRGGSERRRQTRASPSLSRGGGGVWRRGKCAPAACRCGAKRQGPCTVRTSCAARRLRVCALWSSGRPPPSAVDSGKHPTSTKHADNKVLFN
jgi:hypothetical protein